LPDETASAVPRTSVDDAYDNALHFADVPQWREGWQRRSAEWPRRPGDRYELAYGAAPSQRMDLLPCSTPRSAPTALFFHGGFWSRNSKETFRFLASGFHAAGANVAFAGYTLAPEARMERIVEDAAAAVRWLGAHLEELGLARRRLLVVGWSAGAHLAALVVHEPAVAAGMGISGVYELAEFRDSAMNETLRLDASDVERFSPARHARRTSRPFIVGYGARELPAYRDQSRAYHAALEEAGRPTELCELAGHHHHSVLEELHEPGGALVRRLARLTTMATAA
jgi:acetyl esterase/lipase